MPVKLLRTHFGAFEEDRLRHRRRPIGPHLQVPQQAGHAALDPRDRLVVGLRHAAGLDSQRRLAAGHAGVRKVDGGFRVERPLPIDDDAVHAKGEGHLASRFRDIRATGGDPVPIRPQRFVSIATVKVDNMRGALDHLTRDDIGDSLRQRAISAPREDAIEILAVRRGVVDRARRDTTACSRRGP